MRLGEMCKMENDKNKRTLDKKIRIICLSLTTVLIIVMVIVLQEFTWFWKLMSFVTFLQWMCLISDIEKSGSDKEKEQSEKGK